MIQQYNPEKSPPKIQKFNNNRNETQIYYINKAKY